MVGVVEGCVSKVEGRSFFSRCCCCCCWCLDFGGGDPYCWNFLFFIFLFFIFYFFFYTCHLTKRVYPDRFSFSQSFGVKSWGKVGRGSAC